jgi:hypothetical protein
MRILEALLVIGGTDLLGEEIEYQLRLKQPDRLIQIVIEDNAGCARSALPCPPWKIPSASPPRLPQLFKVLTIQRNRSVDQRNSIAAGATGK